MALKVCPLMSSVLETVNVWGLDRSPVATMVLSAAMAGQASAAPDSIVHAAARTANALDFIVLMMNSFVLTSEGIGWPERCAPFGEKGISP